MALYPLRLQHDQYLPTTTANSFPPLHVLELGLAIEQCKVQEESIQTLCASPLLFLYLKLK